MILDNSFFHFLNYKFYLKITLYIYIFLYKSLYYILIKSVINDLYNK